MFSLHTIHDWILDVGSCYTIIVKKEVFVTFIVFVAKPIEDTIKLAGKLSTVIENSPLSLETTPLEEFPFSTISVQSLQSKCVAFSWLLFGLA